MGMTAADYLRALVQLLPPGRVYPRGAEGAFRDTLAALAEEFARIDARADDLVNEADPRTTVELIDDWERALGLPDECTGPLETLEQRRQAIVAKLTDEGGTSRAYYIALAASLGYTITITEFRPFTCETPIDRGIYDESARFTWMVNAPATTVREATCESPCGDPLRSWGNQLLECSIRKRNRATRTVVFSYGG